MRAKRNSAKAPVFENESKDELGDVVPSREAWKLLGYPSQKRFQNDVSNGKIPFRKRGRSNIFLKSELREHLRSYPKGV